MNARDLQGRLPRLGVLLVALLTATATVLTTATAHAATMSNGWTLPAGTSYTVSTGFRANDCGYSGYGTYITVDGDPKYHLGNDLGSSAGINLGTDVFAIGNGTVVKVSTEGWGTGNVGLLIRHTAADGSQFEALYGHVTSGLDINDTVTAGQKIADVGAYGGDAHLHFGIHPGAGFPSSGYGIRSCSLWSDPNGFVDPLPYLNAHPLSGGASGSQNNDIFQATGLTEEGWRVSLNGVDSWEPLKASTTTADSLAIGDFDHDGHEDDVFQASGVSGVGWRVSQDGVGGWQTLRSSTTTTMDTLKLGDFDGDGYKDDVFQATGIANIGWRVSYDGTSGWQTLRSSTTSTAENLAIGDFDHDGHEDDVFYATGANWLVSMNGTSSWQTLRASGTTMDTLKLGDFDGDGYKDDVFQATGLTVEGWRVSHDGTGSWVSLKASTTTADSLAIGDFDGDGHEDDVFQASGIDGVGWRVSENGVGGWQSLRNSTTTMDTLLVGDFD